MSANLRIAWDGTLDPALPRVLGVAVGQRSDALEAQLLGDGGLIIVAGGEGDLLLLGFREHGHGQRGDGEMPGVQGP